MTYNRCKPATTQAMPHRVVFTCPGTAQHRVASGFRCHGLPARPVRGNTSMGPTSGRNPWLKDRVDRLARLLADEHHIAIPPRLLRAELADYLTTFAYLFRVSRMDARRWVTEDMLRASAHEIAQAHTTLVRSVTR